MPNITINISPAQVDQSAWVGNALYRVNKDRAYEKTALISVLNRLYESNPAMDPAEALRFLQAAQEKYDLEVRHGLPPGGYMFGRTEMDIINSVLNVVGELSEPAGIAAAAAKESIEWAFRHMSQSLDAEAQLTAQAQQYGSFITHRIYQETEWTAAIRMAAQNPSAASAIDLFFGTYLNAATNDTAETIYESNSEYANSETLKTLRKSFRPDGSLDVSSDELREMFKEQFDSIVDAMTSDRDVLRTIADKQSSFERFLQDEKAKAEAEQIANEARELSAMKLRAASSGVYILSTFFGFGDQQAGRAVGIVGNAAIQIAMAISGHVQNAARPGFGAGLSGVILSGDIVGAVVSVTSLFASGPTPEQMILEAIGRLREGVATLRDEMHDRFDRIDRGINMVLEETTRRFNRLDLSVGQLNDDIGEMSRTLYSIQSDIGRFERNVFEWVSSGFRGELVEAITGALHYRDNFGEEIPDELFQTAENKFFAWATEKAYLPIRAGAEVRPLGDIDVASQLDIGSIDTNLNYLNQYVLAKFGSPFAGEPWLANPRDWATAAEAYTILLTESPTQYVLPKRIERVLGVGRSVANACQSISRAPDGTANRTLLLSAVDNYLRKLIAMQRAIGRRRLQLFDEYVTQLANEWTLTGRKMPMFHADGETKLTVPDAAAQWIPRVIRAAEVRGLIALGFVPSAGWSHQDTQVTEVDDSDANLSSYRCKWTTERTTARLTIDLEAWAGAHPLFHQRWTPETSWEMHVEVTRAESFNKSGDACANRGIYPGVLAHYTARRALVDNWDDGSRMASQAVQGSEELLSDEKRSQTTSTVYSRLFGSLRSQMNAAIGRELADNTGAVSLSATELSGAKRFLQDLFSVGLSRALEANDYLRALLFGSEALLDGGSFALLFRTEADPDDLYDPPAFDRIELVRKFVEEICAAIDAGEFVESLRTLQVPIEHLELCLAARA